MLYLIGLGLCDESDLSQRALFVAKKCDCYAELYTSKWNGSIESLSGLVEKPVTLLRRKDLEENLPAFLSKARQANIALFVPGDPLAATTHIEILLEARKEKIHVRIIHSASIFSAVAETGLQLYKFGRAATIPFSGQLGSVRNAFSGNRKLGLHTLLLLDLDADVELYMHVSDALKMLLKAKLLKEKDRIVAASRLGTPGAQIKYCTVAELLKIQFDVPAVLVIPGKLHFTEREALEGLEI